MVDFDEIVNNIHNRKKRHKIDMTLHELSNGSDDDKALAKSVEKALRNTEYADATISEAFKDIDVTVSLSAVRNWRIINNVKRG